MRGILSVSRIALRNAPLHARSSSVVAPAAHATVVTARSFGSSAAPAAKAVREIVEKELKHEGEGYNAPDIIKNFLSSNEWQLSDREKDGTLKLTREGSDGTSFTVEYQYQTPEDEGMQTESDEDKEALSEEEDPMSAGSSTDFMVVAKKADGSGLQFFCCTQPSDSGSPYMIGAVKSFSNEAERESMTAYSGPDFEDLEERLKEHLEKWLASNGIDEKLCEFIDASAVDKEQREYMNWLKAVERFFSK